MGLVGQMKRKSSKIAVSLLIVFFWLFTGWPVVWTNPRIPPGIVEVKADSTTATYSFASDAEGWSASSCGAAGGSCSFQSGDGSPSSGSIETSETRKNKGGSVVWQISGITWEDLGVPSGATVTAVDGSYNHKMATCTSCNTSGGNTSGDLLIRDSGDTTTIATLETAVTYTAATSWASRNANGAQSIGASYQASTTGIILQLSGNIQTNNSGGAAAVIRQDEVSLTITYTAAPTISVTVSDGSVGYGYISSGSTEETTSSGLNDTQTATNNGDVAEDFSIKGQDSTNWTLGASAGSEQYVHEFSTNSGGAWTALTTSNQSLVSNVAASGTQDFDLRITPPSSTSNFTQQDVSVTITASQH